MLNIKQAEKNILYNADCLEVLRELPEKSVELVMSCWFPFPMTGLA